MELIELLKVTVEKQGSDLHLSAGLRPMLRVFGVMQTLSETIIDEVSLQLMLKTVMTSAQCEQFNTQKELDFSLSINKVGRFRVNVFMQARGGAAVFRVIPSEVPSLAELGVTNVFYELCRKKQGLILITGPTGCGKSTTLAAMVKEINSTQCQHILTIEDPIEFIHRSEMSIINQRELQRDTLSYSAALRSALREDPDVILIGELRDLASIRLALTAAETGHLVFATLHTFSAAKTVDRIIDAFPSDEKALIRCMLSETLLAAVSQVLVRKMAGGRTLAHEIMIANTAIRHLIRENKVTQMYSTIQTGGELGMITLDAHLDMLVQQQIISPIEMQLYKKYL